MSGAISKRFVTGGGGVAVGGGPTVGLVEGGAPVGVPEAGAEGPQPRSVTETRAAVTTNVHPNEVRLDPGRRIGAVLRRDGALLAVQSPDPQRT
jgi:hypothetical protein